MAAAFAGIAQGVSAAMGAPFYRAFLHMPSAITYDDGGSIVPGDAPQRYACCAQVDAVTEAMRLAEGFTEKDVRILILAATVEVGINTDCKVELLEGPNAGVWTVASSGQDPAGLGWEIHGRPA